MKARELPEALAMARGITAAAERGRVPAPLLVMALDALKRRYTWINTFRVESRGGGLAILLIASEFVIDPSYDAQGAEELGAWQQRLTRESDAAETAITAALHDAQAAEAAGDLAAAASYRARAAEQTRAWEQAQARLDEVNGRIARQAQIASQEQEGIEALARRREALWGNDRLSGGRRLDDAFWRRVDDPSLNRQQLEQLRTDLDAIRDEVLASRRAPRLIRDMEEDLAQQIEKLDHRIRRQDAIARTTTRGHGAQTDAQLRDRILGRIERDVYALDRAQAQRVSNQIEAEMRRSGRFRSSDFHGPESHGGTGRAPSDPHFNIEGLDDQGRAFEVHIYFPVP